MAHLLTTMSGNESPEYYKLVEDATTQATDRDFFISEQTRDTTTQTTEEEFISHLEPTRDASTETPDNGLRLHEKPPVTSETSEESRKWKISNEQEVTHGSDAFKLPKTEICGMNGNENPGYNVLLEPPLRTSRDGRTPTAEEFIKEGKPPGTAGMARLQTPEFGKENPGYNVLLELPPLPTSRDGMSLIAEEFISQETTGDTSTLTPEDDLSFLDQFPVTSETSEERRKRKISNVLNITHGSNGYKLPKTETEQKQRRCSVCKRSMSEHLEVHDGKVIYKCCRCLFIIRNFNYLQMHIYDEHSKPFYCNVCQMKYSKEGSHAYGGTCDLCMQNFECKFELEEHHFYFSKSFIN